MNRIVINEQDLTTSARDTIGTDVVYIPGFAIAGELKLPTLCSTIAEFNSYFGTRPAQFRTNQEFPVWKYEPEEYEEFQGEHYYEVGAKIKVTKPEGVNYYTCKNAHISAAEFTSQEASKWNAATPSQEVSIGFDKKAIPEVYAIDGETGKNYWFLKGQPDPSYIYAKELLYAGIPVIYERVNELVEPEIEQFSAWAPNTQYVVLLSKVYVGEGSARKYYVCKESHLSGETFEAAKWEEVADPVAEWEAKGVTISNMYNYLYEAFDAGNSPLVNKDLDIKYITSGGYPTFEYRNGVDSILANSMINLAASRSDAIALVDHLDNPERELKSTNENSVYYQAAIAGKYCVNTLANASYGAMYTPWGSYNFLGVYKNNSNAINYMPGSYAFLLSLGKSLKTNPNWVTVAGVTRGLVPNLKALHVNNILTNSIADNYQNDGGVSVNAITYIKPYGNCIWGNRTLFNRAQTVGFATAFVNIRGMLCDIKKKLYESAMAVIYEPNTDIVWIKFKDMVSPLLDQMVSGYGLKSYRFIKEVSDNKTKIKAKLQVTPVYAVESFEITIVLTDDELTVA